MQRTQNYNLCQWAAEDRILRSDFNADNQKIDAALKANADAMPRILHGSYTGDGTFGPDHPNTLTLDFPPKLLLVGHAGENSTWFLWIKNLLISRFCLKDAVRPLASVFISGQFLRNRELACAESLCNFEVFTLSQATCLFLLLPRSVRMPHREKSPFGGTAADTAASARLQLVTKCHELPVSFDLFGNRSGMRVPALPDHTLTVVRRSGACQAPLDGFAVPSRRFGSLTDKVLHFDGFLLCRGWQGHGTFAQIYIKRHGKPNASYGCSFSCLIDFLDLI